MDTPERDMVVTLSGWASANPNAAMAWFDSLSVRQRTGNDELKYGLAGGLADRNPDEAAAFAFDLAAGGDGDAGRVLSSVASKVISFEGVQSAASWTESLQAGPLRAAAMDRVANAYVDFDPTAATIWAERFNNQPHSARIIEEVADEVARRDPEHALNWLDSLDPSEGRTQGFRSTYRRFTRANPQAATRRVVQLPSGTERDAALTGVAMTVGQQQHEAAAFDYIGQIGDYQTRVEAIQMAAPEFASIRLPSEAVAWSERNLGASAYRVELVDSSLREVGISSAWQQQQSDPASREAALAAAQDWIATLPEAQAARAAASLEAQAAQGTRSSNQEGRGR
jgi:hypothetical protein